MLSATDKSTARSRLRLTTSVLGVFLITAGCSGALMGDSGGGDNAPADGEGVGGAEGPSDSEQPGDEQPGEGDGPGMAGPTPSGSDGNGSIPGESPEPTGEGTGNDGPDDFVIENNGVQPVRRLSHTEYRNSVRDLLPGVNVNLPTLTADRPVDNFSNGVDSQSPSDLLTEQYFNAARAVAEALTPSYVQQELVTCGDTLACAEDFVATFGQKAFRRPLSDSELALYLETFTDGPGADDFHLGVQLAVMGMLQSGSFLYRPEFGVGPATDGGNELDPFEVATRLSFLVWASTPDDALLEAAASGSLSDAADIEAQVGRLLSDPRARDGLGTFFSEWLKLSKVTGVNKRVEDDWDDTFREEVSESALRFIYDEVFAKDGTSVDLLTSTSYPATPRIAELLGAEGTGDGWQVVEADPTQRAGVLTHPAFLAAHGYGDYGSPVLRGVYIMDRVLCAPPSPPPPGTDVTLPNATGESDGEVRTNREAYQQVTSQSTECLGCHSIINPLGFAFENYDTLGQYRTQDAGFDVDATGSAMGFDFTNGVDLAHQIAESEQYQTCVVQKMLNYGTGVSPIAREANFREEVKEAFAARGYSLEGLLVAIATHERFSRWLALPEAD